MAAPAQAAPSCFGSKATIVGTPGKDRWVGTAGADVIVGKAGSDKIRGRGGNDRICAGRGYDRVSGQAGSDRLSGGPNPDFLRDGPGNDRVRAGRGNYHDIIAGAGDDVYAGGPGPFDFLYYQTSPAGVTVNLTTGSASGYGSDSLSEIERVSGSELDDQLIGDDESNSFFGRRGADTIMALGNPGGSTGANNLLNKADYLLGGTGDDVLDGGTGFDVALYFDAKRAIDADLSTGTATGAGADALLGIEEVDGSSFADTLSGDGGDNGFEGGPGDDTIDGGPGTDFASYFFTFKGVKVDLRAGTSSGKRAGSDTLMGLEDLYGGFGPDTLAGNAGPNHIEGFFGNDVLRGRAGDDFLRGQRNKDRLNGGADDDVCTSGEIIKKCESTSSPAYSPFPRPAAKMLLRKL